MIPRDISGSIKIDDKKNINISQNGTNDEIPNICNFDKAEIDIYCPYCFSKHKLEYSGFFPNKIGYRCDNCGEDRYLLNKQSDGRTYVGDVVESLSKEVNILHSSIAGYNYAKFKNNDTDIHTKIRKFRRNKLIINIIHFLSLILFIFCSLFIFSYMSIGPMVFFIGYPIFVMVGYRVVLKTNKLSENYVKNFNLKDSKLDNIRLKWFEYGSTKGIKENSKTDNKYNKQNAKNKKQDKIKSQN